jgi:hypothetical protein
VVSYRGQHRALFRHDFGRLYRELFPSLEQIDGGFLPRNAGVWDDITFWVFERR